MANIVVFQQLGLYGRFANQLYQIAGTIGIARRNGYDFAFPRWRNHDAANFGEKDDLDIQQYFANPLPLYDGPDLPQRGIPWGYQDVKLTRSVNLLGHFQSLRYFEHAIDEVRWYLTMKDEPDYSDYCAIHWRAGDYGEQPTEYKPNGNPYHPRMKMNYYEPAMAQFPSTQKFLVFSDNIEGACEMFGERCNYSVGQTYFDDFKLMKRCSSFIIANSSYSAMAALLSNAPNKRVIAPAPWFGGPYSTSLDPKDIYNPDWTIINYASGSRS